MGTAARDRMPASFAFFSFAKFVVIPVLNICRRFKQLYVKMCLDLLNLPQIFRAGGSDGYCVYMVREYKFGI
jgi:hypothetical protein